MIARDQENGNICLKFGRFAATRPNADAVVCGGRKLTFAGLEEEAGRLSVGFETLGLRASDRVALMVPPSLEFFALTFALFRAGLIPIFVDPGLGLSGVGQCLAEAAPVAFIGTPKAHLARALGGWAKASVKHRVITQGFWPGATPLAALRGGAGQIRAPRLPGPKGTAAILFTSGSTGVPKGAVYTHGIFCAQVDLLAKMTQASPGETSVPTFPLFGLFDVALGLTAHVPDMDFTRPGDVDPRRLLTLIGQSQAAQLFGSPALLDTVGRYAEARGETIPGLKRILSAGAPVSPRILARWAKIAPNARIHTPYGATEALPVCDIEASEVLSETAALSAKGRGTCVGRPVEGLKVRIIKISDEPIEFWSEELLAAPGEVGEICVEGPVVTARYEKRPRETALAKICGEGGAVIHRMGDLGYFDDSGRLWFCGRKSQRVGDLFTDRAEGVLNAHPAVKRSALVGVNARPVLCVEAEPGADTRKLKAELLVLAKGQGVETILFHPKFPVDIRHNAKIGREKLALWAQKKLA